MENFAEILAAGGKTNSLGRSDEVIKTVLDNKDTLELLYQCLFNEDAWVRMRAIDAIEKIGRQQPQWLMPYINRFQLDLASSTQPSIQWHLAQIYRQLKLTSKQKQAAIAWLKEVLSKPDVDWIVAVNGMKTLVEFTKDGSISRSITMPILNLHLNHKSHAVIKNARKLIDDISS